MERFAYLIGLREQIISEIRGIHDAQASLAWDDRGHNWMTRSSVSRLFEAAKCEAEKFGIYVGVRHRDCGSRNHSDDYVMEPIAERVVTYGDSAYVWRYPLDQREESRSCPCTSSPDTTNHWIIYDIIFEVSADQAFCAALEQILRDLYDATQRAGDNKPRSGIRELLLRSLLTVNDQILPEPLDQYIANLSERR